MVCSRGVLRLGDYSHAMEALGCSAAEEGGWRGGRNGRRGAAKLVLGAAPITEEREWGGGPVGGRVEGRMVGGRQCDAWRGCGGGTRSATETQPRWAQAPHGGARCEQRNE
jgi:hypothetical protein